MYVSMVLEIGCSAPPDDVAPGQRKWSRRCTVMMRVETQLDVETAKDGVVVNDVGSSSDRYPRESKGQSRRICLCLLGRGLCRRQPAARLSYESVSPWYAVDACRNRHYGVQTVDVTKSYRFGMIARQVFDVVSMDWGLSATILREWAQDRSDGRDYSD